MGGEKGRGNGESRSRAVEEGLRASGRLPEEGERRLRQRWQGEVHCCQVGHRACRHLRLGLELDREWPQHAF